MDAVEARVSDDLWDDQPVSWISEWSSAAADAEASGDLLVASLCFEVAKYPGLGNDTHAWAYIQQLRTCLAASANFPLRFERRILDVAYHGAATPMAVHIYRRRDGQRRTRRPGIRPVHRLEMAQRHGRHHGQLTAPRRPFPDPAATADGLHGFRLSAQGLLGNWGPNPTPLLVVNVADDPYVPPSDITMFQDRPNAVVRLEPGATHCAAEKAREINPWAFAWLQKQLSPQA